MFEDIEKYLKDNRKTSSQPLSESTKDRLVKKLQEELGTGVTVEAVEVGKLPGGSNILSKINGLAFSLNYMAQALGVKPLCLDAKGNKLKVGDRLLVPIATKSNISIVKVVLEVGCRSVSLSHTDDPTRFDGVWFESDLKTRNLVKE